MHAGRHYTLAEVLRWTAPELALFIAVAAMPPVLDAIGLPVPPIPWSPIALIGTAVAFMTGFKNNASYTRSWEGRQIWGGIVNSSRAWAMRVRDLIPGHPTADPIKARLIDRHFAWLTALRHQLRQPRTWETAHNAANSAYRDAWFTVPEWTSKLEDELPRYLSPEETAQALGKKNRASWLLAQQSADLATLAADGLLTEQRQLELVKNLEAFYEHQGRCERLKNFPYPRQYASMNRIFVWIFIVLLPFGLLAEFRKLGDIHVWLTIPTGALIAWLFHTMDKIGSSTENPFEGNPNDVPISTMARGIEIDLRDLRDEADLPAPLPAPHDIAM